MRRKLLACVLLCLVAASLRAAPAPTPKNDKALLEVARLQSLETGLRVAAHRVVDVNQDGHDDLLVVGRAGEVRTHLGRADGAGFVETPVGLLVLPAPKRTALAVADVLGTGVPQLAVLSPEGLAVHTVGQDGGYRRGAISVLPRARLRLRLGVPTFAEILRDVNADGRPDLVLPRGEDCELWLNDGATAEATEPGTSPASVKIPAFRRTARARLDIRRSHESEAGALSDVLESSLRIPQLQFEDINGDGRADLVVASDEGRSFHLQKDDGTLPEEPDVQVDLKVFKDTTPEAQVKLGSTLAGEKDARMEVQDLDRDGIPDYVISHRRKVWIFHGTKAGPQFTEPTSVLKMAEDITALVVLPIDDDDFPDLLLLRVQIPELGSILKGLFTEWDLDVTAIAYGNQDGRSFDKKPRWRNEIAIRLPAILGVLRDPERLIRKFENLGRTFRNVVAEDFTGDGQADLAMLAEDEKHVEVWDGSQTSINASGIPTNFGDLLFGDDAKDWSLDGMLEWLSTLGRQQAAALTGGRDPDGSLAVRDAEKFDRVDVTAASLGSRHVLLVAYDAIEGKGERRFDVYEMKR